MKGNKPQAVAGIHVCGSPRSGTTAFWEALLQHPDLTPLRVLGSDKEHWFVYEFLRGRSEDFPNRLAALDQEYLSHASVFLMQFLNERFGSRSARYLSANPDDIFVAPQILGMFPSAQILVLLRHPQETIWSMLTAPFAKEAGWWGAAADRTSAIRWLCERWHGVARQINVLAATPSSDSRSMIVRHEHLVDAPERTAAEVLEFLKLPTDPVVGDHLGKFIWNTSFSHSNTSQKLASHDHYREAYQHRRSKIAEDEEFCDLVSDALRDDMALLGYRDLRAAPPETPSDVRMPSPQPPESVSKDGATSNGQRFLREVRLVNEHGRTAFGFGHGDIARLLITIEGFRGEQNLSVSYRICDVNGYGVFGTTTFDERVAIPILSEGEFVDVEFSFPVLLKPGHYGVDISVNSVTSRSYSDNVQHDYLARSVELAVLGRSERPIHYAFLPHHKISIVRSTSGSRVEISGNLTTALRSSPGSG